MGLFLERLQCLRCEAVPSAHRGASSILSQVEGTPLEGITQRLRLPARRGLASSFPSGENYRGAKALPKQSKGRKFLDVVLGVGVHKNMGTGLEISKRNQL